MRGQSSVEYIMNYGGAALVISVVLFVLFTYVPIISTTPPDACEFEIGLACESFNLHSNGSFEAMIFNGKTERMTVYRIACLEGPEYRTGVPIVADDVPATSITMGNRATIISVCRNKEGETVTGTVGEKFHANFFLLYYDENGIERMERAKVFVSFNP